jgi:hypothetical protein
MRKTVHSFFLLLGLLFLKPILHAQSSSFLGDAMQDIVRRNQLLGKVSPHAAFMINGFSEVNTAIDSLYPINKQKSKSKLIQYTPIQIIQQFNSGYPHGLNDGAMIAAKGLQHLVALGIEGNMGNFSYQLRPEFVVALNPNFETFSTEQYPKIWESYYRWLNKIDQPEQMGRGAYNKIFAGQSFIQYNYKNLAFGISTENIWWGPGRFNALVMSNNAPGFLHFNLKTTSPFQTAIGRFESQIVMGSLQGSGVLPPDRNRFDSIGQPLYQPKPTNTRSLVGLIMSWQPKWTNGLSLGFTAVSYGYNGAAAPFNKKAIMGSLFARYIMPAENAELYFEYGRNDKVPTLFNLAFETGYPRAYVAGFRKLFATRKKHFWEFAAEFTQLQLPTAELTQTTNSWYTSEKVPHGYTHQGQVIGAGIGPGSNSQIMDISYVNGMNKIGVKFERLVHNNDFYYYTWQGLNEFARRWVDLSTTIHANWQFKQLILSGQMGLIRSQNYQWRTLEAPLFYFSRGYDRLNFHSKIALTYRF